MLNVGILASGRAAPKLVKLTDRQLPSPFGGNSQFLTINRNGQLSHRNAAGGAVSIAGEWWASTTPVAWEEWEFRATWEAGDSITATYSDWKTTGDGGTRNPNTVGWGPGGGGRFLLEIRDAATQTVRASARFWTSGFAP